mmetsp:Transcript_45591/g.138546  ORF Transcript_45591/g.138546 Transcript_45591/m.138546 type:complete len:306 (-) Transcript_45591:191-1108(-)
MIIHGNEEKVVPLVDSRDIGGILTPRESVAVNSPLDVLLSVLYISEHAEAAVNVVGRGGAAVISVAEVRVVSWVLINALRLIRGIAVPVVVVCLPILHPTAEGCVQVAPVSHGIERGEVSRQRIDDLILRLILVNSLDSRGICLELIFARVRLYLVVPLCSTRVVLVVELGALAGDLGEVKFFGRIFVRGGAQLLHLGFAGGRIRLSQKAQELLFTRGVTATGLNAVELIPEVRVRAGLTGSERGREVFLPEAAGDDVELSTTTRFFFFPLDGGQMLLKYVDGGGRGLSEHGGLAPSQNDPGRRG